MYKLDNQILILIAKFRKQPTLPWIDLEDTSNSTSWPNPNLDAEPEFPIDVNIEI